MTTSSSSHSHSKGSSSKSKGKGKESSKKGSSSRDKTKSSSKRDGYAGSLSNRAGLERFMHEPAYEAAWNPVGAASSKK
ncbi:hypothetical protein C8A00DRAFT_36727 [Chaetomidium leptoderma]|uniref:Uncharacterized protein n=1 Tax=Chaetomidium leptoderma TaxID=669021 RepID=A0AAN6ZUF2_9PEZI|nr:hypothetical protein C8A00DRAFT_36727 [Chaetomidium leptoderma]